MTGVSRTRVKHERDYCRHFFKIKKKNRLYELSALVLISGRSPSAICVGCLHAVTFMEILGSASTS